LALLIVAAYIGATVFQAAPVFAASADKNGSSMNGMMHKQDGQDHKMPCKGMLPGCVTDPGVKLFRCKFMTAPGCQFDLRAAALKKIEAALVEAGISFAGAGPQTILVRRTPDP
jgi:hypothetical protein